MRRQARVTERDRLVIRADDLTSQIIIARDPACVTCGSIAQPTNGHLFGRTNHSARWDVHRGGNCARQCWPCNERHTYNKAPYRNWYKRMFGQFAYEQLEQRWRRQRKFSDVELRDVVARLEMHARALGIRVGTHRIRPDMETHGQNHGRGKSRPTRNDAHVSKRRLNRRRF